MTKNTQNLDVVVKALTTLLADGMVLYTKTRNFHWNITGPNFTSLHAFLEDHYTELAEETDSIAEKIRTLQSVAIGSMKQFLEHSTLKESTEKLNSRQMLETLLKDEEQYLMNVRQVLQQEAIANDDSVSDLLTTILVAHEKKAWMIRVHLD